MQYIYIKALESGQQSGSLEDKHLDLLYTNNLTAVVLLKQVEKLSEF